DEKISIRSKRHIRRNKIDWMLICRVFSRISVRPKVLAAERSLHNVAAIDVAMIENVVTVLATQPKSMCATTKFFTKRAYEFTRRIVNNDRFSAHACLVDC